MITRNQKGFTLVELMIATTVFSIILLLCATGLIFIGKNYYKGVTSARTQTVARDIVDIISQGVQFGSTEPAPEGLGGVVAPTSIAYTGDAYFCIGSTRYSYRLNHKVTGNNHAFIVDTAPAICNIGSDMSAKLGTGARELLAQNMRLFDLQIVKVNDVYDIVVNVGYGDDDLVIDNSDRHADDPSFVSTEAHCKGGTGDQFCSVSRLDTSVHQR